MSSKNAPERRPRTWSLAARLTTWYGISAFVLIVAATGFLYWALVTNLDREDDEFLTDKVHLLQSLLSERPEDTRMLREEVEWEPAARRFGQVYIRILDGTGRLVLETPGMSAALPPVIFPEAAPGKGELHQGKEISCSTGRAFRILAARGEPDAEGRDTVIQIALDRTREEALLSAYRKALWLALGIALAFCLLTGYHIARRGLRPVAEIGQAARRIRSTTLHERLARENLPAELSTLAGTFNEMLDRLQESFERLARFSADIAHELRTPVNNLRGEAEVALSRPRTVAEYREVLSSCLEECGRLAGLIDNLLFVARAEDPRTQITKEPLDAGKELATVREFYEAAAAEAGVRLDVEAPSGLIADLDRTLFQRALGNLVANALAHTPRGGIITLAASQVKTEVRVEVADTGSGIAPEHLPYVFDRFYRADPARSTASGRVGLGLALVKSIAVLHGGSVAVTSEVGKGTRVCILFPCSVLE
jgi:two-component system heavy metal sensor histidine kinase CusS